MRSNRFLQLFLNSILALSLALPGLLAKTEVARAQTSVFVNEIHYDNTGTDAGEAIEVAGPAGTDLAGWSLVRYNGANSLVYNTTVLSGTIPDQDNGFGTLSFDYPENGIQNGSPDGMALVDPGNNVIQFLSYEGTFTALDGLANGMTSTDIGVSQSGSGAVGNSLQLTGSGTVYEHFTWAAEAPNTFGSVNTDQSFGAMQVPDPLINEFVFNHTGTDTNEYVEVFGEASTDYSAFSILQIEGDGTGAGVIDTVLAVGITDANGFWTTAFLNNTFENGTVSLLLVEGFTGSSGDDLDAENDGVLDSTPWTRLVDDVAVSDGGAGDFTYSTTVLTPGFAGSAFVPGGASRIPDGTDTDSVADWVLNDFDLAGIPGFNGTPDPGEALNTPGTENALVPTEPLAPELVINEIDYDQPSTDTAEFIEIKNIGASDVNLDNIALELVNGTGGGATIYLTIDLPDVTLVSDDYYVVCANAATVSNCDLDVDPNTDLIQNGAPDAVGLRFEGQLIDAVSYEGDTGAPYTEGSGAGLIDTAAVEESISRCPDGQDTDQNNVDFVLTSSTPGEANACGDGGLEIGMCGDAATFIHQIQGDGLTSPLAGTTVVIEGVVVGDFQNNAEPDNGDLNGFYVQEEDTDADSDQATSEGLFVFAPSAADVGVGNQVRVLGDVTEFSTSAGASLMTELTNVSFLVCVPSVTLPEPNPVTLPVSSLDDFERYEGMLVTFPQALSISEFFNFDRFNEIVLTLGRQHQPTALAEPGSPEAATIAEANRLSRITLDDGRSTQNPDPAIHPNGDVFDLTNRFRGGDTVQNATGVIDQTFGLYRIHPTEGADYTVQNPRPEEHEDVGGSLKVASFNVLNYFLTLTSSGPVCGPALDQDCRGADNPEEFERQRSKILAALSKINADIVGLIEMENTTGVEPMEDIVAGLNDLLGPGTYAYIDTGTIGTDVIKVGIIYKPASVTPVGDFEILDSSDDPRFDDTRSRPMLAQTFMENATGGVLTVAVNHLKSKGSDCGGPPDDDPEQGNCNGTRTLAAEAIVDWLATDPTGSGDADFLIIGDLNAYDKEDPIDVIRDGSDGVSGTPDDYTDLVFQYQGEFAYSYLFDGQLGYLDHALANQNLVGQVAGTTVWHINADEPDILDYDMTFKQDAQDALFEPNAFRSSDHDPVIVGLDLNGSPSCLDAAPSLESLWPANHGMVRIDILGITDPEGDPITLTIDSIFQDEAVDAPDSGNTAPDGGGLGTPTAEVRAERVGTGNGRVYHISFTVRDDQGGSCISKVLVSVPISQNGTPAVDDGPLFDSTIIP